MPKEVEMKAAIAAIALTAVAAAPIGAAHAHTAVTVGIDTPAFGIRIGAPYAAVAPLPLYPAPVYVAAPVYAPPPPVVYAPPRVVFRPPVVYPIVYPYGQWKHGYRPAHRAIVPGGYAYGRY
jgi:hypothetical protein